MEIALREAISVLNNTLGSIYEQQYVYQNGIILNTGFNYGRGEDPFVYRTVWELWAAQYKSRGLCRYNEFAIGATENRVNYVCGEDGYGVEVQARYAEDNTKETIDLARQVTDFLDIFKEVNAIEDMMSESVLRSDEDGEWFIRLFYGKDGMTQLRFIEPEHIRPPFGDNLSPAMSFGIETPENDVLTPIAYHVVEKPYQSSATTRIPANEVVHGMWNNRSSGKRGYPSFLPVEPNLRRCEALLQSLTQMARTRAKIALIRTLTGVDSQTATALMQNLTASRQQRQDANGTAQSVETFADGQIVTHGSNMSYTFPPPQIGSDDFVGVLQEELKAIATRFQMPLWMFAAVADAKYNNAFIVEAPSTKAFTKMQRKQHRLWVTGRSGWRQSIYWRAIVWAVKRRILPEAVISMLKLVAKGPAIVARDKLEEANMNKVYYDMGAKDTITIQHEQGFNPDEVASNQLQEFKEGRTKFDVPTMQAVSSYLYAMGSKTLDETAGYQLISLLLGLPLDICKKSFPVATNIPVAGAGDSKPPVNTDKGS